MTGSRLRPPAPAPSAGTPRPLSVLLVVDSLDGGGAERYVVDLAVALRRRGWPVHVACSVGGIRAAALADAGVPVTVLLDELVKRRVSGRYERALTQLVADLRPAVVHAHLFASAAAAVHAVRDRSVPLVVTEHTEGPWRDGRARAVSGLVYRDADLVVAVSSAIRDLLVTGYGVAPERVEVLLPTTAAPPVVASRSADPGRPVVGVVGRLVPEKGVDVFLRAATLASAVVPQARFLVVGDGPLRPDLEHRAAVLGLADAVTFTGYRSDAPRLLAGLDVLAVPSRSDGSPLVVCEAMAAGVPVVASRVGGLPDLIEDGGSGLLVRPGEAEDLARALVSLLLDPEAARRLGARGRRLAAGRSHERLVDRMTQLYAGVARAAAG
ncbi:glycosyltransferase [Geodermatophilus sp. URMC 61]|uniref:glycosyltransferase n=1 Tax=Geodermatophilus sp. URMC 61 TaxID=3423411 RepID=UPI00406C9643